jgi:hypothetical protein
VLNGECAGCFLRVAEIIISKSAFVVRLYMLQFACLIATLNRGEEQECRGKAPIISHRALSTVDMRAASR